MTMRAQDRPAGNPPGGELQVVRHVPLARHTTFRTGGPAEYWIRVSTRAELIAAVNWGRRRGLAVMILGNGSNILVADEGVRGLVIENHTVQVRELAAVTGPGDQLRVQAESGVSLPGLANGLARRGWSGLEWAIGVPGTVGAAVVTNAGAHGSAIADTLLRAEILDGDGRRRWWLAAEMQYDYRTSCLKSPRTPAQTGAVVLQAEFALQRADPAECIARMNRYTEHRRRTQPTEPSVGSMFKNPPGDYAGRLIEAAGLKGVQLGQVQVSPVHANFFVNLGGATCAQVMELVRHVQAVVLDKFGVELVLEIQLVGAWPGASTGDEPGVIPN